MVGPPNDGSKVAEQDLNFALRSPARLRHKQVARLDVHVRVATEGDVLDPAKEFNRVDQRLVLWNVASFIALKRVSAK